jgi:PAS domain S-box-containing protein
MVSEKILIIDDSPIDARFASKILTEAGYTTTIIHDALDGLTMARQLQPELILLDVTMPKMDGYQVCQQLKADPETRDIATVLYTIRDQFIDCLRGIEAGADDFIIKSLSADDFLGHVKKILTERRIGLASPTEALDMNLIQPLARRQDRQELLKLLFGSFNKHVRESMNVFMGAHVSSVLIDRAIERTARGYPFFRGLDQAHLGNLIFDSEATEGVPSPELVDGFQAFSTEVYQLVTKLTRTRLNGAKEARAISNAYHDMVGDIHAKYEELRGQMPETGDARAGALTGRATGGQRPDTETGRSGDTETVAPAPPRPRAPAPLNPDCTFDAGGNLIYSNDDLSKLLGYSKVELMGHPFSHLLTPDGREALNRTFERLVEKGAAQTKLQLKAKDGSLVHADALLTALYDSQGRFAMTRCSVQVVPASQLVQEREEEIGALQRALRSRDEEFGALASTISHDLRQPLHAILVLCQFLEEEAMGTLTEQAQGYIKSIQQAGTKLKEMIEDLVHYARINSSSNAYEEVNLGQVVDQIQEDLAATLSERRASLLVMGELPAVTCDRERITELLAELITNGIKFNDKPQPVVEVGMVKEDSENYTFYLKDNGIGIEEPYHESIFRLFHRLHKPEEYGGTGAGLAVCKRIVEAHGGRIWVRSQLGTGATVFFTLPREMPAV